jgi:hypothetical protein
MVWFKASLHWLQVIQNMWRVTLDLIHLQRLTSVSNLYVVLWENGLSLASRVARGDSAGATTSTLEALLVPPRSPRRLRRRPAYRRTEDGWCPPHPSLQVFKIWSPLSGISGLLIWLYIWSPILLDVGALDRPYRGSCMEIDLVMACDHGGLGCGAGQHKYIHA